MAWFKETRDSILNTSKRVIGVDDIKRNGEYIVGASKVLFGKDEDNNLAKKGSRKNYKFSDFVRDNNVSTEQLRQIFKRATYKFYLFAVANVLGFCFIVYYLLFSKTSILDKVFSILPTISAMLFFTAFMLQSALVAYQISHKTLIGFREFLSKGKDIIPTRNDNLF